jgi:hypothetical protein
VRRAITRLVGAEIGFFAGAVAGLPLGALLYETFGPSWWQFGYEFEGIELAIRTAVVVGVLASIGAYILVRGLQQPRPPARKALAEMVGLVGGGVLGDLGGVQPFVYENVTVWGSLAILEVGAILGFSLGSSLTGPDRRYPREA